jgi:CBS domain-containing protein
MKSKEIGPVPVVQNRKVIGIVTDRDLAMKVVAEGRNARKTKVKEIMTPEVVTCHADDDVQRALDAMTRNQVRRIPVVDEHDDIVGMIAQADVAMKMSEPEKLARVVKEISRPDKR